MDETKQVTMENVFQSTRPQGARHVIDVPLRIHERVSIHAPAGGAT